MPNFREWAVLAVAVAVTSTSSASAATPILRTTVDPAKAGPRVASSFLGLSIEYPSLVRFTGAEPWGRNAALASLVNRLGAEGGGPLSLRVGGGSSDGIMWNPGGGPRPDGLDFGLAPYFTDSVRAFLDDAPMPLLLGVPLAFRDTDMTMRWVREAAARLPDIVAFELGNEPELWPGRPYGTGPDGKPVFARPKGWGFRQYLGELRTLADRVRAEVPGAEVAAPSALPTWAKHAQQIVRGSRPGMLTYHHYPLSMCHVKSVKDPQFPTIRKLLDDRYLVREAFVYGALAQAAHERGAAMRLSETNTASCGGRRGVSDRFASALWGIEWMMLLASGGVDGVNFHASSPAYAPVFPSYDAARGFGTVVRPLYYGMAFFAKATAQRGRFILPATSKAKVAKGVNVRAWATVDDEDTVRVLVNHRGSRRGGIVDLQVKGASGPGTLERLTAPRLTSSSGRVRLNGQSFARPTYDGALLGAERTQRVGRRAQDRFRFRVPAGSAALLVVKTG